MSLIGITNVESRKRRTPFIEQLNKLLLVKQFGVLRGNQDETRATIWMRFLGRGRDQVITLIAADKFFVIF